MKKANLGGRWGEIAAFKFFIGFQVGRIFLRWYMTGKSRSRCCTALTLWLWSPRSQKPCWHAVRLLSPQFLPCLSYLHRTFHFSVTLQIQATLSVGSFWPPLGALAHNYFYKNLLPLLHSLLTSLSSASPILLCGCWNLDTAKAPAVSAIAVYHPAHPSVFTMKACQLIMLSSGGQGWTLASTQHAGILLCASTPEHNRNTNILTKQYLK